MDDQVTDDSKVDPAVIPLPAKARLAAAEDTLQALKDLPTDVTPVIDASATEEMSTPVVAVLLAALKSRSDQSPPLIVNAPTPAFIDAFSDLGFFADLMKMEFRQ